MSHDALPPLPTTDDPFELLGVERDVDERELKRGYARMIKRYRPDRAPAEFARLQAAFEQARWLVGLRLVPDDDAVADRAGDEPVARASAGPRPEAPASTAPPTEAPASTSPPRQDVEDTLGRELEAALDRRAPAEVLAVLDDDAFVAAAEDHLGLALLAMRAFTTMAWHDGAWPRVLARYRELPHQYLFDEALAIAEIEVSGAAAIAGAGVARPPAALVNLLRRRRVVARPEREQLIRRLARELDRDRASYLRAFDELHRHAPDAASALGDLMTLDLPPRATESGYLPDQVYQAVFRRLQPVENLAAVLIGAAVAIVIASCYLLHVLGVGAAPIAIIALVLAVGGAVVAGVASAKLGNLPFAPRVRHHVGGILVAYAVPASAVSDCLQANPEPRGFLHRYVDAIEDDRGLALLGLTATLAWSQRLVWRPVVIMPPPADDDDPFRNLPT